MTDIGQKQNNEFDDFAKCVLSSLQNEELLKLSSFYDHLSKECDLRGKLFCLSLKKFCLETIVSLIMDNTKGNKLQYFAWHYLQLMTIDATIKDLLKKNFKMLPQLLNLHAYEWTAIERSSLNLISLNFVTSMLGEVEDSYYEHVADCGFISWLHELLDQSCLSSNDVSIELILLILNLILEGTDKCKKQLNNFNFSLLLNKKIQNRESCNDSLLKIANMTYQKLLLLTSDQYTFVETFRKGFKNEFQKSTDELQQNRCFFSNCTNKSVSTFKRCSQCKMVTYCSKECQISHWKVEHSKVCGI